MHIKLYYVILIVLLSYLFSHYFFIFLFFFSLRISEKGVRKTTIKNNKNESKDKKPITLRLDDDQTVLAKSTYNKNSRAFNINDIDIGKIRDKKLYIKSMIHTSIMCFRKMMNTFL